MLSILGHHPGDDDLVSKMFDFYFLKYFSHVNSSMPLNVFFFSSNYFQGKLFPIWDINLFFCRLTFIN